MTTRASAAAVAMLIAVTLASGCTGGKETAAAEEQIPQKNGFAADGTRASVDPRARLDAINPAIPLYAGARYRDDLTRRDEVMIRNQHGPNARVYTLATNDSFPQVYHYYTTYLAQFRAYQAPSPLPSEHENWRTLEVQLNQAMQDPFIPGEALQPGGNQVVLQVAETEAEPKTVIRYIVMPPGPAPVVRAASTPATPVQPVAR